MKGPAAGVLVLDKPSGPTSHDIVMRVRRALATREVGHAGTLDPMATGVLVIAVGEATKLVPWLTAERKRYRATIALGAETDTLDAGGRIVAARDLSHELRSALDSGDVPPLLEGALAQERTRASQVPPSFSAIHSGGERAYAKARRGEAVLLDARVVEVHELTLLAWSGHPPTLVVELEVSKGYYVRSLARDLANALGTIGHLTALRRTRSGGFVLEEAAAFDAPESELTVRLLAPAQAAARVLPVVLLTEAGAAHARSGRAVPQTELESLIPLPCAASAWIDSSGALLAVGEIDGAGRGRVLRGFSPR
jgi:tRNA pseudouridine55 synthase